MTTHLQGNNPQDTLEAKTLEQKQENRDLLAGRRMSRRELLAILGVGGATVLVAACAAVTARSSGGASAGTTTSSSAPSTTTPEITATPSTAGAATTSTSSQNATPQIVAAANAFLATLNDNEKDTVSFDWTDTAQKQRWSNFPPAGFQREGLRWGDMNEAAQNAWLAVMQTTLSSEGYNRVLAEWNADEALLAQQGNGGGFGKANYYIALIGAPSKSSPWQWQWGGHHVTVNATVAGPNIALTPSFIGVQPASYNDANGNKIRPLGDIEDEALALINLLDATQQKAAILGSTPIDLVLGPGQDGKTLQAEGLLAAQMNADQQAALMKLISHYTGLGYNAAARTAEIQSTFDQSYLAWYGPTSGDNSAYFRVSGPTLVIEYAPQGAGRGGNGGGIDPQHVHGIYRDPTNDYGAKYTS